MENVFETPRISRAYIRLAFPVVLSMVVTLVYNLADTYFVAQTNNTGLVAGVSLAAPLFTFLMGLGNIFGQGGTSLISRLLGRNESQKVRYVSSFCFYAALLIGILAGGIMLAFRTQILYLLGANQESFPHASDYFTVLAEGAPFLILSFIHSNILRSEGMSVESMFCTSGGAILNIILDPILISVFDMGAFGAAAATIAGYIFSDICLLIIVRKKSKKLSVAINEMKVTGGDLAQLFGIGVPAAFANIMTSISMTMINQFLLPYGNDKIAAMGIALKVVMIAQLILVGFAFGGLPLFGYHFGAQNRERLSELFRFCLFFISGIAIVLSSAIFLAAPWLMRCFMDNAEIVSEGVVMLRWQVVSSVCVGFVLLMNVMFQAAGEMMGAFLLSVSRQGIIFIIILLLAVKFAGYNGIIASQAISDTASAILAVGLFFKDIYGQMITSR